MKEEMGREEMFAFDELIKTSWKMKENNCLLRILIIEFVECELEITENSSYFWK